MIQVRHGLMIVGPTGGGKTKNYQVLQQAITELKGQQNFQKVLVDVLNPKSITMGQLYGYVDPGTQEWKDGVLAKLVNEASKDESPDLHWIMFDGPVDALWIENMNTVLDDNKKLCLNSGQIIQLTPRMTMMFEVADLAVASPATVSRCGMVYMEPESLTVWPFVTSWMNTLPEKVKANKFITGILDELWKDMLEDGTYLLRKQLTEIAVTVQNNVTMSCFRLLDCFMAKYHETEIKKVPAEAIEVLSNQIKQIFMFCFTWSIGGTTDLTGRKRFDSWIRERMVKHNVKFPEERQVYDWYLNQDTGEWMDWYDTIPVFDVDIRQSYNDIIVPTTDSIRMKFLMRTLITNDKHVLMPGPTGTGKSVYVSQLTTFGMPEEYLTLIMCFSAQTSANQTQDYLQSNFEKRRKNCWGPPLGKKFIVFVDDLNMPQKEQFFAQPPIELLR